MTSKLMEKPGALCETLGNMRNHSQTALDAYKNWRRDNAEALIRSSYLLCEDDLRRQQVRETLLLCRQMSRECRLLGGSRQSRGR